MPRNCSVRAHYALALALLLGTATTPALAVSVNDMVVWSATNQPLRMDVELVDLQGANVRDLSVVVASAAEHERVGLKRPDWADSVRFKIISSADGKVVARASSSAAVSSEFVSFMVSIRAAGIAQLQQVASKVSSSGAEPLVSAKAEPVAARSERAEPAATEFADKPVVKPAPVVKSGPVAKPASAPKPAVADTPVVKAAPKPAPAPVEVPTPSPAPAELVAAAEADNEEVLADVGAEPTLESLQAERTQILQQITELQTRASELDQQINALSPETMPETETATALAETDTSSVVPEEEAKTKVQGHTYFANVLLVFLGLFIFGMAALDRVRARLG